MQKNVAWQKKSKKINCIMAHVLRSVYREKQQLQLQSVSVYVCVCVCWLSFQQADS